MDYDDFSADNNPFAGSNHYYSNGILNSTDNDNDTDNDKDYDNDNNGHDFNNINNNSSGNNNNTNDETIVNESNLDIPSSDDEDDLIEQDEANNTTTISIDPPTIYNPNFNNDPNLNNSEIIIKTFEILKDYKGTKTVFYKIFNLSNNTFVLRRYNDFKSLRSYLCKFFPYLFIPPIPEKHSISKFLKNPFSYKNDISIIELRIRLLNYFLIRLNLNKEISNSLILKKFLDPLNSNWLNCLKFPPFTNLSSNSILLISTKNPTKPSPYFSFLPIPPLTLLKKFKSNLNNDIFLNYEKFLKNFLKISINLESIIKKLIEILKNLRLDLIEFGGFLNIFSIIENQNFKIEKFGNKIDLNFLNIEILINNLIIKIKEPLIILKNSIIYLLQLLHFRKSKDLQLNYFQKIITKKQKKLLSLINLINPKFNNNNNSNNNNSDQINQQQQQQQPLFQSHYDSPSLNLAIKNLKRKESKLSILSQSSSISNPSLNTDNLENNDNKIINNSSIITSLSQRQEIISEIKILNSDLNKNLVPAFKYLLSDLKFLNLKIEQNLNSEILNLFNILSNIMNDWKLIVWGEYVLNSYKIWSGEKDKTHS